MTKQQIIAVAFAFSITASSHAALVAFDFTGTVYQVDPLLTGSFAIGNIISGKYIFDTSAVDANAALNAGQYEMPGLYNSVTAGGFSSTGAGATIIVFNEIPVGAFNYNDVYYAALHGTSPSVNGLTYNGVSLSLSSLTSTPPSASPITSDALPLTAPPVNQFDTAELAFNFLTQTGEVKQVSGHLSTLTIGTVPEPSSALLLLTGAAFCFRRRPLRTHERSA